MFRFQSFLRKPFLALSKAEFRFHGVGSRKNRIRLLRFGFVFYIFIFLNACTHGNDLLSRLLDKIGALPPGTSFPSPGSAPAPEGSDLFSISTNYSAAIDDPDTKADPLSGAMFIAPPEPNNYGAISLNYPIIIPSGRAGVQPSLSVSYSSTGGDGWVGVGWSLGLGAITRTPEYGALYYDSRDSFTWNGKRLIKVEGSASTQNGTYRPEVAGDDFAIVRLSNIENGGIWEVLDSSGTKTTYGAALSSRIYNPSKTTETFSWYLTKTEDRNGNFMEVEYDTSEYSSKRNLHLKEIRYTGNSRSGVSPRQYVRFKTTAREDFYVTNAAGFLMRMDRLLDRIEVGWSGGQLWKYDFVYETSGDSGRPRLKTIESDHYTTQPEFTYQNSSRQLLWQNVVNQVSSESETNPNATEYFEGDFNGDGISDMLYFNASTGNWKAAEGRREGGYNFKLYANRYKNYEGLDRIRFFKGNVSGDYNGDGRADIAFYLPETREFVVAEHNGSIFEFKSYGKLMSGIPDIFRMEWFPGDYDGNGLSDAILFDELTGQWTLMLNKGGQFEFLRFSNKFKNLFRGDYSPDGNLDSKNTADASPDGKDRDKVHFLVGDYNGDGRTDISLYDSRSGKWIVGHNNRNPNANDPIYFKIDWILYKVFTGPEQALFANDRFSGDFDGDGFSDFLLLNRANGEWILGQTGNGTIEFKVWSKTPQFKQITRFLQGDFNGDGRTDIGFFSATDGKFWIGEATLNGFRYRIYSDMSYGPNQERVMQTPLPRDEVKISKASAVLPNAASGSKTVLLDYQYDANDNEGRGELVFAGCFTVNDCSASPELLIYDRAGAGFDIKQGANITKKVLLGFNPEGAGITTVYTGKPDRYTVNSKDEVLFFKEVSNTNQFFVVRNATGTSFETVNLGSFTDTDVGSFYMQESVYLIDNFENTNSKSVLVLDDQPNSGTNGRFIIAGLGGTRALTPTGDLNGAYFFNLLKSGSEPNRLKRKDFSFFSGNFVGAPAGTSQIAIVDRRTINHIWYLGTISGNNISFKKLSDSLTLPVTAIEYNPVSSAGIAYGLYPEAVGSSILIGTSVGSGVTFHKYKLTNTLVTLTSTNAGSLTFNGEFDHTGKPVVIQFGDRKLYDLAQLKTVTPVDPVFTKTLDRPDLMTKVYPFQWVQGDYNGDGLTDVGIIHLKEPTWYFALSNGIVPDVINKLKNGIGGSYEFEYEHSTKFDNTGGDGIPDLPTSYRVCTKITLDNGFGTRIPKVYEYSNGVAFSAFINGKKENDFFGFSNFTQRDAYGARTVHNYNRMPYSDFMMNRALAGAEKEMRIIGSDNQDYGSILYAYEVKKIETTPGAISYFTTDTKTQKFLNGVPTITEQSAIVFDGYKIKSRTETDIDHYSDGAHPSESSTNLTEFETDNVTNQTRAKKSVSLVASSHETTTTNIYDSRGNLIRSKVTYSGSGLPAVTPKIKEFEYDIYGNLTLEKDVTSSPARGTSYVFDNQLHQFAVETTSFGGSIRFTNRSSLDYGKAFGEPLVSIDPNGNKTYFEYDQFGRLEETSVDTDNGVRTDRKETYSNSFPLSAKTVLYSGNSDPDFESRKYIDGLGKDVHQVKSGSNGKYIRSGKITYDAAGRLARTGQADWADSGEIDTFVLHASEKNPTIFEYDAIGRIKKTTSPLAAGETAPSFNIAVFNDPFETIETESSGKSKRTIKNGQGQILYIEDFATDGVSAKIGFCYDDSGNRVKKADLNNTTLNCSNVSSGVNTKDTSGNNQVYWQYDAFGKLRKQSDPDLGVNSFEYNEFGDLKKQTDPKGFVTTLVYDAAARVVTKQFADGETYFRYDSNEGSENAIGQLVAVEDRYQSKTFSYDKLGRTKKETRFLKEIPLNGVGGPYTTEYEYDLLDRVKTVKYPEHPVNHTRLKACYEYGSAGYITGISVQTNMNGILPGFCSKTIVENIVYSEFGQTSSFAIGNGIESSYEYDVKGRLTRVHSSGEVDGSTKVLQDAIYSFNAQSNIVGISNSATDYTAQYNYEYDGLKRLVYATGFYNESADPNPKRFQESFAYAKNGNLTAKRSHNPLNGDLLDERAYQYNNHQVVRIDSSKYGNDMVRMTYDASGNMISQRDSLRNKRKQIEFDSENRINAVKDENGAVLGRYWYDEGGFRIRKSALVQKGAQYTIGELYYPNKFYGLEYVAEENLLYSINNIYLNGVRIAALAENGNTVYYLSDQVDSVSHVLDEEGKTLSLIQYQPYGETFVQSGNKDFAPKYNSQELDRESEFYFYNARHYDPAIARFTSADTVINGDYDTQGWNRFSYVKGNPVLLKDPTGHVVAHLIAGAVGAAVGLAVQGGSDLIQGKTSSWQEYTASAVGGAAGGVAALSCGPACAGAVAGAATDLTKQALTKGITNISVADVGTSAVVGAVGGKAGQLLGKGVGIVGAKIVNKIPQGVKDKVANSVAGFGQKASKVIPDMVKRNASKIGNSLKTKTGIGSKYEVLAEATIKGTTRDAHRRSANKVLADRLTKNPNVAAVLSKKLGKDALAHMKSGKGAYRNPPDAVWHHPVGSPEKMQLLRTAVHDDPGLQSVLHPGGSGGFADLQSGIFRSGPEGIASRTFGFLGGISSGVAAGEKTKW